MVALCSIRHKDEELMLVLCLFLLFFWSIWLLKQRIWFSLWKFTLEYLPTFSGSKAWDFYLETCQDFRRRHNRVRKFPKMFEVNSTDVPNIILVPVLGHVLLNTTSFPMHFLLILWDLGKSIIIYSFSTESSFLASVWVYIFWKVFQLWLK